jgi:hypothetical protein
VFFDRVHQICYQPFRFGGGGGYSFTWGCVMSMTIPAFMGMQKRQLDAWRDDDKAIEKANEKAKRKKNKRP